MSHNPNNLTTPTHPQSVSLGEKTNLRTGRESDGVNSQSGSGRARRFTAEERGIPVEGGTVYEGYEGGARLVTEVSLETASNPDEETEAIRAGRAAWRGLTEEEKEQVLKLAKEITQDVTDYVIENGDPLRHESPEEFESAVGTVVLRRLTGGLCGIEYASGSFIRHCWRAKGHRGPCR